jgi:hypothetical protein
MEATMTNALKGAIVFWAVLAMLSLSGATPPPPSGWLEAWTKWIAAVVGIVVSARVLWSGAAALDKFANRSSTPSNERVKPTDGGGAPGLAG